MQKNFFSVSCAQFSLEKYDSFFQHGSLGLEIRQKFPVAPVTPYSEFMTGTIQKLSREGRLPKGTALDLCCGSGVLAVALAKVGYDRVVVADIMPEAVSLTIENLKTSGLRCDVRGLVSDMFSSIDNQRFSLIVCNPPSLPCLSEALETHERFWFDGGPDGRRHINRIIEDGCKFLSEDGFILLEHTSLADVEATIMECMRRSISVEKVNWIDLPFREFYSRCINPEIMLSGKDKLYYQNRDILFERIWSLILRPGERNE